MSGSVRVALADGDGIGPEIMKASLHLLDAAGVSDHLSFERVEMGRSVFESGETRGITDEAMQLIEECGLLYKGPMETIKGGGGKSINVTLRKVYGAFANLRHFQSLPGVETVYSKAGVPVDFYVVRENVEDTYGGVEHRLTADVVECKRIISAPGCDQVHKFAFDTAARLGIEKVHCGHKANIMKMTDGLFLDRFRTTALDHPTIEIEDVIIDALCMGLVRRPQTYRMVVLPNLQGDIVSDLAAGLVGGLGFAPSANIGDHISIFEAVHGTAPDIAGRGIGNPTSLILSGLMMLRHIGLLKQAAIIENALLSTLESGIHTGDFGSGEPVGTAAYVDAMVDRLGDQPKTVAPLPVPEQDAPTVAKRPRPQTHELMRTFTQVVNQHVGCDVYLEESMPAAELAERLMRLCEGTPFRVTMISSRGTKVWPTGSVYTELVDYLCVRFELREGLVPGQFGQGPAIALLSKIAEKFAVCDFQPLRNYDGERGFSLAQGQ